MNSINLQNDSLKKISVFVRVHRRLVLPLMLFSIFATSLFYTFQNASAQNQLKVQTLPLTPFRIGERLTYSISFEKFNNAAYAEIYVVSRGKLGEKDAVELRSKIKTNELVSAFYLIDETRATYASSDSGLPLYVRKVSNAGVTPKETVSNYTVNSTAYNDLLTMIYQARNAGGAGTFSFQEDDKIYNAIFQNGGKNEKLKNEAGEFDTSVSTVQSEYLTEKGIMNLRVNFSTDAARIPVLIRFKTAKGDFRADLASVQTIEPEATTELPPVAIQTPRPVVTPRPAATPTPYIENEPLATELPFKLGETLEYQISTNGRMIGMVTLQARERKLFSGQDSLLLTATVTGTEPNHQIFKLNDAIRAQVNPLSLAPQDIQLKLSGALAAFNQQVLFDQRTGTANSSKTNQTEIPVGTHSILSLAYAVRSFNLKPSKDLTNPVNDTRVAVFLDTKAYVLTLRPANADLINLQGERISAQLITITANNPAIDQYSLRLWLGNDDKRVPLRLMFGAYQADLVSEKQIPLR
ncbi:MAG: DUF3108 domain-containing protein [Acidobacteriota bacterium]|nr:DUF3108 domain-containing protein [Acidobacteriota bacterium]